MRTIIAGVDGSDVDDSLSALLNARLAQDAPITAARVVVEDLGGDPLAVAHRLDEEWPRFDRVIFVGAVARERPAGTVSAYRWNGDPNGATEDLAAFDSTLLAVRQLADVPDHVIVVEVEPDGYETTGPMSSALVAGLERARTLLRRLATNGRAAADLPSTALGGVRTPD